MQPAGGVNRRARGHAALAVGMERGIQVDVEPAADHRQGDDGLEERKLIADALALTAAEGEVREVLGDLVGHLLVQREALGDELVGLRPEARVAMQVPDGDEEIRPRLNLVPVQGHGLQRPSDQHRGLRVEPHGLVDHAGGVLELHHVLDRRPPVADDTVNLLLNLPHLLRVRGEEVGRPRQHSRRGLVPRDEQRHEVVPELLGRHVVPGGDEKVEDGRIVAAEVLLDEFLVRVLHNLLGALDEHVESVVDDDERFLARLLPRHEPPERRDLPVRDERHRSVLSLAKHGVHSLDHRVILLERVKVVVEHGFADDVQRQTGVEVLHLHRLTLALGFGELRAAVHAAVSEHVHHRRHVLFVQTRHHGSPPNLPRLAVRGNEAGAHDEVQNLGQQTLAEGVGLRQQHLLRHLVVRHDDELLRPDGEDEHLAVREEELVQRDKHGLAGDLANVTRRDGHAAHGLVPPLAGELGEGHGESSRCSVEHRMGRTGGQRMRASSSSRRCTLWGPYPNGGGADGCGSRRASRR